MVLVCWPSTSSVALSPGGTFRQVSVGGNHACGLKSNGTIACWGDNSSGQLNAPSGAFNQISTEGFHTCGLKSDGTLICWGDNTLGQLTNIPTGAFGRRTVNTGGLDTGSRTWTLVGATNSWQLDNIPSDLQPVSLLWHTCGSARWYAGLANQQPGQAILSGLPTS
jgi:hypothetical protein